MVHLPGRLGVVIRLCSCAHHSSNSGTARVATEHLYGLNGSRISAKRGLVSHMGCYEGRTVQQRGGWVHGTLRENESLSLCTGHANCIVPRKGSSTHLYLNLLTMAPPLHLYQQQRRRRRSGSVFLVAMGAETESSGLWQTLVEHYDQLAKDEGVVDNPIIHGTGGSSTRRSMVVFSLGRVRMVASHAELTADKYRGRFVWFPQCIQLATNPSVSMKELATATVGPIRGPSVPFLLMLERRKPTLARLSMVDVVGGMIDS